MLRYTVREEQGAAYEMRLEGRRLDVYALRWNDATRRWWRPADRPPVARAEWDFTVQAVRVAEKGMGREMVAVANRVFGEKLRALDVPRQEGLFPDSCSVCGADRETFPETAVRDEFGNIVETDGRPWVAPDQPVQWPCHVCGRLVCRNCVLTHPGSMAEIYYHTYCSEACRAAAPEGFAHDDEVMR